MLYLAGSASYLADWRLRRTSLEPGLGAVLVLKQRFRFVHSKEKYWTEYQTYDVPSVLWQTHTSNELLWPGYGIFRSVTNCDR